MSQGEKFFQVLMNLQAEGKNVYNGVRVWRVNRKNIYGGELVAQGIMAASQTITNGAKLHSIHARFIKGGNGDLPVKYEVEAVSDGNTFSLRSVKGIQENLLRFYLSASFKKDEPDSLIHVESPEEIKARFPRPDALQNLDSVIEAALPDLGSADKKLATENLLWLQEFPCDIRPCNPMTYMKLAPAEKADVSIWMRLRNSPAEVTPFQRQACLAYMSDMGILRPLFVKNPTFKTGMVTSLDHAIWFHDHPSQQYHPKNWVLFHFEAVKAGNALSFNTGRAYSESGVHLATIAQEGLFRPPLEKPSKL